jgi:hypothetical protein
MEVVAMQILRWLGRIVEHGRSTFVMACLLGACALIDLMAWINMEAAGRWFARMDKSTIKHMALIDLVHDQRWMAAAYVAIFLFCLVWAEFRGFPLGSKATTFLCLALPCLMYGWCCFHIAGKFILRI